MTPEESAAMDWYINARKRQPPSLIRSNAFCNMRFVHNTTTQQRMWMERWLVAAILEFA